MVVFYCWKGGKNERYRGKSKRNRKSRKVLEELSADKEAWNLYEAEIEQ